MPQWQGKSKGTPLGYRIFVFVCRRFGLRPAYVLLYFVAAYYFFFSFDASRHIYRYYRRRLQYGIWKAWWRIYANYYVFGQTLIDKVVVMAGLDNPFTYHFDGEQHLQRMVQGGGGGILISAHVGNWEAAGHLLKRLQTRINVVMFDGEHRRIKAYLQSVTGGHNFNVIVIRPDMSHVYAIGEALQKNELVCLHGDRFVAGNKTRVETFLGAPAQFPLGPFQLAAGFRVPVSLVFAFKASPTHYHFYGSPPLQRLPDEAREDYTSRLIATFVRDLEQKLALYPDQWFNYYDFWDAN